MKYAFLLVTVAVLGFFWTHRAALTPVTDEVTQKEAAPLSSGPRDPSNAASGAPAAPAVHTNSLKRPIDRTREVLGQVKQRNGAGEF